MPAGLLEVVASSPWAYMVIVGVVALDAVFPLFPSEVTVVSAGVLASSGQLSIALVVAAAAFGAFVGDGGAYALGRSLGSQLERRVSPAGREWAARHLGKRAGVLILCARFIPGGRSAITVSAGMLRMRCRRFLLLTAAAGFTWAVYSAALGYAGGLAFEQHPYLGLAAALAASGFLIVIEAARRLRGQRAAGDPCS